jgi:hypothetical protein
MSIALVNPMNEIAPESATAAPRLNTLQGRTIALLDISKPGGNIFLDHLERLLRDRYGVTSVIRQMKPTFAKPAPPDVLEKVGRADAVIEALAD